MQDQDQEQTLIGLPGWRTNNVAGGDRPEKLVDDHILGEIREVRMAHLQPLLAGQLLHLPEHPLGAHPVGLPDAARHLHRLLAVDQRQCLDTRKAAAAGADQAGYPLGGADVGWEEWDVVVVDPGAGSDRHHALLRVDASRALVGELREQLRQRPARPLHPHVVGLVVAELPPDGVERLPPRVGGFEQEHRHCPPFISLSRAYNIYGDDGDKSKDNIFTNLL